MIHIAVVVIRFLNLTMWKHFLEMVGSLSAGVGINPATMDAGCVSCELFSAIGSLASDAGFQDLYTRISMKPEQVVKVSCGTKNANNGA